VYVFWATICGNNKYKQAVGGQPPRYSPAQACNRSAQGKPWARPAEPGPISQYALSSRPAAQSARRPDVGDRRQIDVRQTDVRQHHRLMPPGRGHNKLCGRPPQYAPTSHMTLIFYILTLKVVSESRVTWATSVPILVFLGLCSRLRPDVRVRRQTDRRQTRIIA